MTLQKSKEYTEL